MNRVGSNCGFLILLKSSRMSSGSCQHQPLRSQVQSPQVTIIQCGKRIRILVSFLWYSCQLAFVAKSITMLNTVLIFTFFTSSNTVTQSHLHTAHFLYWSHLCCQRECLVKLRHEAKKPKLTNIHWRVQTDTTTTSNKNGPSKLHKPCFQFTSRLNSSCVSG